MEFAIVLRQDDLDILTKIQESLQCGRITKSKGGDQARFSVQNSRDIIQKIVPFFEKYKLHAKKSGDFELWATAARIMTKYKNGGLNLEKGKRGFIRKEMSTEDIKHLKEIRNKMLAYKSKRTRDFKWGTT